MKYNQLGMRESFYTGIEVIDHQHKEIIERYNDLQFVVATRSDNGYQSAALDLIVTTTKYHFSYEEKFLGEQGYPGLDSHREEHAQLLGQLEGWAQQSREGKLILTFGTMQMIRKWLVAHMSGSDKKYASYLCAPHASVDTPKAYHEARV